MTALPTRKLEAYRYADIDGAGVGVERACARPSGSKLLRSKTLQQIWLPSDDDGAGSPRRNRARSGRAASIFALNTARDLRPHRARRDARTTARISRFDAANIGGGNSTLEIVTTVRHSAPAATSRQTVRSVLGGKATGTYLGKVAVARDAQQTDSEQSVKAMLLDRGATANCQARARNLRRRREVRARRDASASSTANQLFYAAARGLDPAAARALLLEGFVGGLWDDIDGDDQRHRRRRARRAERRSHERRDPPQLARSSVRDQFPAIPAGWHYLDSAATAQKPQAVIDAIDQRLWPRLRHRPPRRLRALGGDDAELRGGARRGRAR